MCFSGRSQTLPMASIVCHHWKMMIGGANQLHVSLVSSNSWLKLTPIHTHTKCHKSKFLKLCLHPTRFLLPVGVGKSPRLFVSTNHPRHYWYSLCVLYLNRHERLRCKTEKGNKIFRFRSCRESQCDAINIAFPSGRFTHLSLFELFFSYRNLLAIVMYRLSTRIDRNLQREKKNLNLNVGVVF